MPTLRGGPGLTLTRAPHTNWSQHLQQGPTFYRLGTRIGEVTGSRDLRVRWDQPPTNTIAKVPAARQMVSNANTGDTGDALNSPEPRRRPLRSPKPSAKVRETLISLENKAQPTKNTPGTTVRPDGAPTLDGRTSVAQRLLIDVCETRQNIKDLKLVIQQQTDMLVKLSTELVSVKTKLATVKTELSDVKQQVAEELKHAFERLDAISNSPALTTTTALTSPNPSYANVARTPPNSSPANLNSISSMETTPSTLTDSLFCTIDTSRVESREDERISVGLSDGLWRKRFGEWKAA